MSKKKNQKAVAADGELPIERVPVQARQMMRAAKSLRPGPSMMDGCLHSDPEACAVRDAWRFSLPIRTVSAEEFADICSRGETVFHG